MYKALIIGAGQIAGGYDNPSDKIILTHAHAYKLNKEIELLGFYDINFEQAQQMSAKWNVQAFETLNELKNIDIISICTPDFCHLQSLNDALKLNPKVIFLEKPISNTQEDTRHIYEIAQSKPILINFSRRFVKEFQDLALKIKNSEFGEYRIGTGYYGKGYIHNGSHMKNLLELLIGKITKSTIIEEINDFFENDTTKTAILDFESGKKFFMQGINCNDFTIFEFDLMFEKARIKILNSGFDIEIYSIKNNEKFKGYLDLQLESTIKTELDYAMANAVQNLIDYLKSQKELISKIEVTE